MIRPKRKIESVAFSLSAVTITSYSLRLFLFLFIWNTSLKFSLLYLDFLSLPLFSEDFGLPDTIHISSHSSFALALVVCPHSVDCPSLF